MTPIFRDLKNQEKEQPFAEPSINYKTSPLPNSLPAFVSPKNSWWTRAKDSSLFRIAKQFFTLLQFIILLILLWYVRDLNSRVERLSQLLEGSRTSNSLADNTANNPLAQKVGDEERTVAAGTLKSFTDEKGARYDALIVNLQQTNLKLFLRDKNQKLIGNFKKLKEIVERNGQQLAFAMNAGIFETDYLPLGLHIDNAKEIQPINLKGEQNDLEGNFYLLPNGVFAVKDKEALIDESKHFADTFGKAKDFTLATQSGPLLLLNGEINSKFDAKSTNKTVRNGVGVIDSKTVVFLISRNPVNLYDFAAVFKEKFGCRNALYLDGAISNMYLPELGEEPSERPFGGILAITTSKKENKKSKR